MDRRSYLKLLASLGTIGLASFSIIEWVSLDRPINPKAFHDKRNMIGELVEQIIPETDTPGAKSAKVHDYVIDVILSCYSTFQQHRFLDGLERVDKYALDQYGTTFVESSSTVKGNVMLVFSEDIGFKNKILKKISNKLIGDPFFIQLKSLTVEGYCMSQLGATKGLAYDYIPGKFESCILLKDGQRSWATK